MTCYILHVVEGLGKYIQVCLFLTMCLIIQIFWWAVHMAQRKDSGWYKRYNGVQEIKKKVIGKDLTGDGKMREWNLLIEACTMKVVMEGIEKGLCLAIGSKLQIIHTYIYMLDDFVYLFNGLSTLMPKFDLHYLDYCPRLCCHVYHNVSAVVHSGLLQVVGMLNLTLYFTYRGRLF